MALVMAQIRNRHDRHIVAIRRCCGQSICVMAVGLYAFAQNATKRVMTLKIGVTQGGDTLPLSLQLARHFVVAGKRFVDRVGKYSAVVRAIDLNAVVT